MKALKKITLIGSGNVATHLGKAFFKQEYEIDTVYSKSKQKAVILAGEVDSFPIDNIEQLDNTSDIYILSIKDDAIASFLKYFPFKDKLIVHTSGNTAMNIFETNGFSNYGILYPLQTFSIDKDVYMDQVPFCIEGSSKTIEKDLMSLAGSISSSVYLISSEQRKKIHLAAVFACNFSNHMYTIAESLLAKDNIELDLLKPLILETAKKINSNSPREMQTGPAIRNDKNVLKAQLEMLTNYPDFQEIYRLISENIQDNA